MRPSLHDNQKNSFVTASLTTATTTKPASKTSTISSQTKPSTSLPYTASNVDDFLQKSLMQQQSRERIMSSGSDDNLDYEPYSRRDFRMDLKSPLNDSKIPSNDTPTSGYFTSPNEHEKWPQSITSPESSDYEKFEHQRQPQIINKKRDEHSSSPVGSHKSTSSQARKSVSFDLDVEEYTPAYNQGNDDGEEEDAMETLDDDEHVESRFHQQPKRIKGILRSQSPNVYYKTAVASSYSQEKESAVDDDEDVEIEKENPFRKEYLSEEELNLSAANDLPQVVGEKSITSDSDHSDNQFIEMSGKTLVNVSTDKTIFKSAGSLVTDSKPKVPPPRPPKPHIKKAEVVKNEGLQKMSQQMVESDFMEFVHDAKTNTIQEVIKHDKKDAESFSPDSPLPPLPKVPPPPLNTLHSFKRATSLERPKESPPPPPTPTPIVVSKSHTEIVEILPAKYDVFPQKQTPNFVNENFRANVLVTEDEHREILLAENEIRNAIMHEYVDDKNSSCNSEIFTQNPFSPNNPFLDHGTSSSSFSYQSSPSILSPASTLEKSTSSFSTSQYTPVYKDIPRVSPILPPQPQVLPVHYGQLPKPQQTSYALMSNIHYNPQNIPATSIIPHPSSIITHQPQHTYVHQQYLIHQQPEGSSSVPAGYVGGVQSEQKTYLVSGDGSNNFYISPNNNSHNRSHDNNQIANSHQTLLMQSAYMPTPLLPLSIQSSSSSNQYLSQQQQRLQNISQQSIISSTTHSHNNNRPQYMYEHEQKQLQQHMYTQVNNNDNRYAYQQQQPVVIAADSISELSPIRVNPQNFNFPTEQSQKPSMSSFGKSTEV